MKTSKRGVALVLLFAVAAALLLAAPAVAMPRYETEAYYSVVHDLPYAAYSDIRATSIYAYYSVVHEEAFAPYTDLKSTSIYAYYSVLH